MQCIASGYYWPKIDASILRFANFFQGYPACPYLVHSNTCPNMATYAKYGIWDAFLTAKDVVKWGIPEKILQNEVQMRWPCVNRMVAQGSNLRWELLHTAKRGGLSLSMEGLEGVEEQRRRGKQGLKLLLSKVKVLLLSLSRTIIVCGFRF